MKLDDFETDIILAVMRLEKASTWALAQEMFTPKNRDELKRADQKIRYHTKKMLKDGILIKHSTEYSVNRTRVNLTNARLSLDIGTDIPLGTMLIVLPKDDGDIWMRAILSKKTD